MNYVKYVKDKLKNYDKIDIIITTHALIRLKQRQIDEKEVVNNLINPTRLDFAIKEDAEKLDEQKFDCYFGYSKTQCHRYVIILKDNVVVVTVVKINRRWQKIAEKKLKR